MSQKDFFTKLIQKLEEANVEYMVSGSLGSSMHGEPRATNDIDLVIAPTEVQLHTFIGSLSQEYYIDPEAALDAYRNRTMFNVIDRQTGWKADLIIRKDREFSREEFRRQINAEILGVGVKVISPEDAILSKLEWSKESESELQFRDALGVAVVQWENLDMEYLKKWSRELGFEVILEDLIIKAKDLQLPE